MNKWNPDNLKPSQIGNGYRLLDMDEIPATPYQNILGTEHWHGTVWRKKYQVGMGFGSYAKGGKNWTLRTKLTREQLAQANERT